jgi:hypothetical protein
MTTTLPQAAVNRRQMVYWRLLSALFSQTEQAANLERMTLELADDVGLPPLIADPNLAVDTLLQRYPELKKDFAELDTFLQSEEPAEGQPAEPPDLRRDLVYSKLLLNVFGPNTLTATVSAEQYNQWCQEVGRLERCFGFAPGALRGRGPAGGAGAAGAPNLHGGGPGTSGQAPRIDDAQLQASLKAMEGELIQRMALRELLADDHLAAQLPPSMPVIEQLLLDKANLSGNALKNAKMLIRKYVAELTDVFKTQVQKAVKGKADRSVPPKRSYRNLDLKRTLWKNLPHFNPHDGRLYVDQLFYRRTGRKDLPKRLIVVVDQSGSMVDAMVQTAILASIFGGLPKVDVHLLAFDTNVLDLTAWVHDPFEVLMRTNLGGGNDGPKAMVEALRKVQDPHGTVMVWISDFYEFQNDKPLFEQIKAVKASGVKFIPVGALKSGQFSLNEWFRVRLKEIGLPVISGDVKKLIRELKSFLG